MSLQLPTALFESRGLTPRRSLQSTPAGTSISRRPFATPQRLPVARQPFRDRSSRPAASLLCGTFTEPVRLAAPSLSPVSPGLGGIGAVNPFPESSSAISISSRTSTPLWGCCTPPDRSVQPGHKSRGSPPECVRLPFAPRRRFYWNSLSFGSTFQARLASVWLAVPRTSWNQVLCCIETPITVK